jgi:hypothetical protein
MEQFAQRIAVDYHLEGLNPAETREYIDHRLAVAGGDAGIFEDAACEAIYRHSGGIPRLINLLCDTCLVYGYAEGARHITAALANDVAHEKQRGGIFPKSPLAGEVAPINQRQNIGLSDVPKKTPGGSY